MKLNAGNIWSGNRQLAVFTNPTELAFRKGNLRKHWPIVYKDRKFADAEAAYQFYANGMKHDFEFCKSLCVDVLTAKLRQYEILAQTIEESGGLEWISRCSHIVHARTANFKRWEGVGLRSVFIDCLYKAYSTIKSERSQL